MVPCIIFKTMSILNKLSKFMKNGNPVLFKENREKPIDRAIFNDDVRKAFLDFVKLIPQDHEFAIIGGIALGVYTTPRNTMGVDVIVLGSSEKDDIMKALSQKFRKIRSSAIEHKSSGVEIELLTPELIKEDKELVRKAISNAKEHDVNGKKIKVVTPTYLIALKIGRAIGKGSKAMIDRGDIIALSQVYGINDLSGVVSDELNSWFKNLISENQ